MFTLLGQNMGGVLIRVRALDIFLELAHDSHDVLREGTS